MLEDVKQIFKEDNGHMSMMRVVVTLVVITVLFNWTWHNITTETLSGFRMEELIALLGPLGFKVWQKGKEK